MKGIYLNDVFESSGENTMIMLPEQCRAARALLDITQIELAKAAETGNKTIADFEGMKRNLHATTVRALKNALEAAGIEFLDTEGKYPGVRLKKRSKVPLSDQGRQIITLRQCKAARAFLSINQKQLASMAGLAIMSIVDFERGVDREYAESTLTSIRSSLEKAGIEFIDPNGGGPGVRLKKKK